MRLTNRQPHVDRDRYRKRREDWLLLKASRAFTERIAREALDRTERAKALRTIEEQLGNLEDRPIGK